MRRNNKIIQIIWLGWQLFKWNAPQVRMIPSEIIRPHPVEIVRHETHDVEELIRLDLSRESELLRHDDLMKPRAREYLADSYEVMEYVQHEQIQHQQGDEGDRTRKIGRKTSKHFFQFRFCSFLLDSKPDKPEDSLVSFCLRQQRKMMEDNKYPWLACIRSVLNICGMGDCFENISSSDTLFLSRFSERLRDIALSDLIVEAHGLSSLRFYMSQLLPSDLKTMHKYLNLPPKQRRVTAMLRFNLKYSLPFYENGCCKHCNSHAMDSSDRWDHLIYDCETLPPLDPTIARIPYPYCVVSIEKELSSNPAKLNHIANSRAARLMYVLWICCFSFLLPVLILCFLF